jgi:pimeloyl-ACP methyl ester carboxylesterase
VAREPFQYAVIRLVPDIEREEFLNVGVIVFCRTRGFLQARVALDPRRLEAMAADLDLDEAQAHLDARVRVAAGAADAGPIAQLSQSERFHWLVAPSSTIIQTSPVHSGLCEEPDATLERLFATLVLV